MSRGEREEDFTVEVTVGGIVIAGGFSAMMIWSGTEQDRRNGKRILTRRKFEGGEALNTEMTWTLGGCGHRERS